MIMFLLGTLLSGRKEARVKVQKWIWTQNIQEAAQTPKSLKLSEPGKKTFLHMYERILVPLRDLEIKRKMKTEIRFFFLE